MYTICICLVSRHLSPQHYWGHFLVSWGQIFLAVCVILLCYFILRWNIPQKSIDQSTCLSCQRCSSSAQHYTSSAVNSSLVVSINVSIALFWPDWHSWNGNRTTRRQTNSRSVKSRTGQLAD